MTKNQKPSDKELQQIGEHLISIYETGYLGRKPLLKYSFLKGLMAGFGGVLGATILIGIMLWAFSILDEIPLVGRVFENVQDTVETKQD